MTLKEIEEQLRNNFPKLNTLEDIINLFNYPDFDFDLNMFLINYLLEGKISKELFHEYIELTQGDVEDCFDDYLGQ